MAINLPLFFESIPSKAQQSKGRICFLHGWALNSEIWSPVVELLIEDYDVTLIDLPGMGRSPVHNGDYDLNYIADCLQPFLQEPAFWVGWSLGACVLAGLIHNHETHISGALMVTMGPRFITSDQWSSGIEQTLLDRFQALLAEDFEGTIYRFLGLNCNGSQQQKAEIRLLQQLVFCHGIPARRALVGGLEILAGHNAMDLLVGQPNIFWCFGRNDHLVPLQQESLQLFHEHQVKVFERSAHLPFITETQAFTSYLKASFGSTALRPEFL